MTDKPIIFSVPMVRALMLGTKTQTRRVLKHRHIDIGIALTAQTGDPVWIGFDHPKGGPLTCVKWPYAKGDRLWVREAHAFVPASAYRNRLFVEQRSDPADPDRAAIYREGFDRSTGGIRWRPSIHMPRWASRLTLVVTDVRVQRVQEISEADIAAEGIKRGFSGGPHGEEGLYEDFADLWNTIHGPDAWDRNDWVAAISFTVHSCNIDQMEAP